MFECGGARRQNWYVVYKSIHIKYTMLKIDAFCYRSYGPAAYAQVRQVSL